MDVEIISKTCIKPSSSTPSHLKTYNVSLFDQFMPPVYFSTALFYPKTNITNISQRSFMLKHSLSKTLSQFYPLAGKIKDYISIDCNDEGAYYTEARANIPMSEYLIQPDLSILKQLVPDASLFNINPIGAFLIMIQETTFPCGGLALGLTVSHMVLDGTSLASFIKAWASSSKTNEITYPYLDSPFQFPLYEPFPKEALFPSLWSRFARKQKVAVRRLVFDESAIAKLKSEASLLNGGVENPSRVEVVSAIISRSLKAALNAKTIAISHAVNMRRKATPPIPDCSLGNCVWPSQAICTEEESQFSGLVYKLRNAIRKLDSEFMQDAEEGGFWKLFKELKEMGSRFPDDGMEVFTLSSWCNFGLYNHSDFGWGKPIWISVCTMLDSEEATFYNAGNLNDTRNGKGVEAWLYLSQDIAAALEKDDELFQYASLNPSPLLID